MKITDYIPIQQLCTSYQVEITFLGNLQELGLIEVITIEETEFIHHDQLTNLEKMIRLHQELEVKMEDIDIVFNLLGKINDLQDEVITLKNRLRLYEGDD